MIWHEGLLIRDLQADQPPDYMNTAPQMIIALLRQLVEAAGVRPADITICDTLAYLVQEYYEMLHGEFPQVQYADHGGKFGRVQVQPSTVPFYWSCRPADASPDFIPACFAEAEYFVNLPTWKAHTEPASRSAARTTSAPSSAGRCKKATTTCTPAPSPRRWGATASRSTFWDMRTSEARRCCT